MSGVDGLTSTIRSRSLWHGRRGDMTRIGKTHRQGHLVRYSGVVHAQMTTGVNRKVRAGAGPAPCLYLEKTC